MIVFIDMIVEIRPQLTLEDVLSSKCVRDERSKQSYWASSQLSSLDTYCNEFNNMKYYDLMPFFEFYLVRT